jgi:hypothetical protein
MDENNKKLISNWEFKFAGDPIRLQASQSIARYKYLQQRRG